MKRLILDQPAPLEFNIRVALAIRWLRRRRHLTQKNLAELCKIRRTLLCRWERGGAVPTTTSFLKLAKGLNVSPFLFASIIEEIKS